MVYGIISHPITSWVPALALYASLIVLGVLRKMPLQPRAWAFTLILFLFGVLLTYSTGVSGDGQMYLGLSVIMAGILLGKNSGIALLISSSTLIAFFCWSELTGFHDLPVSAIRLSSENSRWIWLLANYVTINLLMLVTVLYLIHKLQRSYEKLDHRLKESLQAQQQSLDSAANFKLLAENSSDIIWATDLDLNLTYISPAVESMRGYTPEEALGLGLDNISSITSAETIKKNMAQKIIDDNGKPDEVSNRIETRLRHKDGSLLDVEILIRFLRNDDGSPFGIVGVTRDVTERKRLENAMQSVLQGTRKSLGSEFFNSLAENLSNVLKTKCVLIGELQKDESVRTMSVWMDGSPADNFTYDLAGTPCANVASQTVCTYPRAVQKLFPEDLLLSEMGMESYIGAPLINTKGDSIGILVCMHDKPMSELQLNEDLLSIFAAHAGAELARLQAEREREKISVQLLQSQKLESIGQLTGGIAHDFNNLLAVIQGYLELARDVAFEDAALVEYHEQIQHASERAASLTHKLLSFSRRQVIRTRPLNLNELIGEAGKLLKRLLPENIDYETILAAGLGTIEADAAQLEQAIVNLALNAKDAMPAGGKFTIETENILIDAAYVETHPWANVGRYVLLHVSDSGVGIPLDMQDRVFKPFFTTKPEGEGSGLGLSVFFGIIKQHGGFVHMYSELEKGTEIRTYLPIVERTASSIEKKLEPIVTRGNETLLLVEDNQQVRKLAETILTRAGYTVIVAEDGELAIERFKRHADDISLLLLDVVLPKADGREVMEEIRKTHPDIPVLFSSGYSINAIHTNFILEDDLELLSKPYSSQDLLRKIREMLDRQPAS